ncbi:unnamed protein product [Caenorhabditis auriculariae]|uniref:Uncharacterized protein n=1 Tax=Caenorhabditis auriculariae TaxID=2777116 RepID=A0A8S1HHS9_9PELO|nr:unnamed protein product [Caenorhabditis auriculariae]
MVYKVGSRDGSDPAVLLAMVVFQIISVAAQIKEYLDQKKTGTKKVCWNKRCPHCGRPCPAYGPRPKPGSSRKPPRR